MGMLARLPTRHGINSACHSVDKVACIKVNCNELNFSVRSGGVGVDPIEQHNFACSNRSVVPPHDLVVCTDVVVRQDDQTDISTLLFVVLLWSQRARRIAGKNFVRPRSAMELPDLAVARVDTYFDTSVELETKKRLELAHKTMTGMLTLEHPSGPAGKRP